MFYRCAISIRIRAEFNSRYGFICSVFEDNVTFVVVDCVEYSSNFDLEQMAMIRLYGGFKKTHVKAHKRLQYFDRARFLIIAATKNRSIQHTYRGINRAIL